MFDTIMFDGSGTLFDDLYTVWKADSDALEACGLKRITSLEQFKQEFRFPLAKYRIARGAKQRLIPKLEKKFRQAYPKYVQYIKVYPEVKSVLQKLMEKKINLAVVSNIPSFFLEEHLQRFGIKKYFTVITGQDDCIETKPSPMLLIITLEKLGSNPCTSAYVGDQEDDILATKRANVYSIGVTRKSSYHPAWRLERQNPDFMISNLNELLALLNSCKKDSGLNVF